jgi:signal peptidase II
MKLLIDKERGLPFILTGVILAADQLVKSYIVKNWPVSGTLIRDVFNNGLLRIYHVRNKAIAFSLGAGLPESLRPALFIVLPILVLVFLLWYYFSSDDFTVPQRWAVAGIVGGGLGNIIDRIFRPDGVVDFISVKFYGFLGLDRWPTFNIADSGVVVCCLIFLGTILLNPRRTGEKAVKT